MEDKYDQEFDQLFARDLKAAGQNAQPDPEEWPTLSSRLDAKGKRRPWLLLLPWLLLSALTVSNGWMLVQWQTLHEKVADLQRQPQAAPPSAGVLPEHRATVVYDTIYRTVVVTRRVVEERVSASNEHPQNGQLQFMGETTLKQPASTAQAVSMNQISANKVATPASGSQKSPKNQPVDAQVVRENQTADNATSQRESTPSDTTAQAKSATTSSRFQPDSAAVKSSDSTARQPAKSHLDTLLAQPAATTPPTKRYHEPLRWRIGVGAGIASPVGGDEVAFSKPFGVSLTGELLLGKHWAVAPSLMYAGHSFNMEEESDPRLLIDAPVQPSQDFRFQYIEGSMAHWVGSLALRYRFQPNEVWSWYLGAGYAARFTFSGKAEYEFRKQGTGEEYHYEITPNIPARTLMGEAQGGLEFALRPRWALFGEMSGLFDLGPGQRTFPMLTGQLGVKWRVK